MIKVNYKDTRTTPRQQLKSLNIKLIKRSASDLMIFAGISVFWRALFIFKVLINLITSLELVSPKVNLCQNPFF